jgi:hypothetical protein
MGMIGSAFAWCDGCYGGFVFERLEGEPLGMFTRCPCCLELIKAGGPPEGLNFTPEYQIRGPNYVRPSRRKTTRRAKAKPPNNKTA